MITTKIPTTTKIMVLVDADAVASVAGASVEADVDGVVGSIVVVAVVVVVVVVVVGGSGVEVGLRRRSRNIYDG